MLWVLEGADVRQLPLLGDGDADDQALYDASPEPPQEKGGAECAAINRPCDRYRCQYHLWPQTERPGRPHTQGARPPVIFIRSKSSCALDEARANQDGMSVKKIGKLTGDVCGERVRQIEQRGSLKMLAVSKVLEAIEDVRPELPKGSKIVAAFPHNEHHLPNQHFITVIVEVKSQAVQPLVRKRDRT